MATSEPKAVQSTREFVDDRDLAVLTPISRGKWQALRQNGGGPLWRKVGHRCIYRWSDVVAWLEMHPEGGK